MSVILVSDHLCVQVNHPEADHDEEGRFSLGVNESNSISLTEYSVRSDWSPEVGVLA